MKQGHWTEHNMIMGVRVMSTQDILLHHSLHVDAHLDHVP